MRDTDTTSEKFSPDYDDIKEQIEGLWKHFKSHKYHRIQEKVQRILQVIQKDLANDFGQNTHTSTLYEDPHKNRRKCYLNALNVYKHALSSLVKELLLHTDTLKNLEHNITHYQTLRQEIQGEMYEVTYLLGQDYSSDVFITSSDLEEFDTLMERHCQFILKREFFKAFKIVIQALGDLTRKDFHKVTEPYKNLRTLCQQCLHILEIMRDERFFGPHDTFIEDYENDVNIYLQILWYLAIKTDLNKIDKFLHPNTYSGGLDEYSQVFAALSLMESIVPHIEKARNVNLQDNTSRALIEEYAEYLYNIVTHEEEKRDEKDLQTSLSTMKTIIETHTTQHEKVKYRLEFAVKWFKKRFFAFRIGEHKRVAIQNPEGRILCSDTNVEQALNAFKSPIFPAFFDELQMLYRSRTGVKLQKLRWSWFAERELQSGFFQQPKYDYLKYIHSRWEEKVEEHYHAIHKFSRKHDDDD